MLTIGLTGGIAAGKSVVSRRFRERGALVIDADQLARAVVEPGSSGLAEVVRTFGTGVLLPGGGLDRPALGALIFGNADARTALNAIIHPLVRAAATQLTAAAQRGAIVVQDIPLLVETGQGASFHLVVVVHAPEEERIRRLMADRRMAKEDAAARIRAQATDSERCVAADVIVDNSGGVDAALRQVDELWERRLEPFARNLQAELPASRSGPAVLVPADPRWPAQAGRLAARIRSAAPDDIVAVDHIGSTAVPGLDARDVLDLQIRVRTLADADTIAPELARCGFPRLPGQWQDQPKAFDPDPTHWQKRLHGAADPGRAATVHVRADGSPGARYALAFRAWLRAEPAAREAYLVEKRRMASVHAAGNQAFDEGRAGYDLDKEAWLADVAEPGLLAWIHGSGWKAPWEG